MHDPSKRPVLLFETESPAGEKAFASLDALGYPVARPRSAGDLLRIAEERDFSLVMLPCPLDGIALDSLIAELRRRLPRASIVLMAGVEHFPEALALTESGATDCVMRPPEPRELRLRLQRLLEDEQ